MKRILCAIIFITISFSLSAQLAKFAQRQEIVQLEVDEGEEMYELFSYPKDSVDHYYLSVGHLGFGDEVIQFYFDPAFELFLPLGASLAEAAETLKGMQELFKTEHGTSIEMQGCLAFGVPDDKLETVTVTFRRGILSRRLEFSVKREGYIRSTYIAKSDLSSIVSSLKFYRKLHPKKQ